MRRVVDAAMAVLAGAAVTVPVVALVHDQVRSHPPVVVSWTLTIVVLAVSSWLLGPSVVRAADRSGRGRAVGAVVGVMAAVAWISGPPLALLSSDIPTAARLAWTLGEEDNSQIIGVAREVIMHGPAGGGLADQFGTGFVVIATTAGRMLGADASVTDPRILAIEAFTTSVVAAIAVLGLAMALLAVLGPAPRARAATRSNNAIRALTTALVTAVATVAALGVAVVLPMRTGFLSFSWAFAWAAIGVALLPLLVDDRSRATRALVWGQVLLSILLLVRTWPFLIAAFLPAVALALRHVPWRRLRDATRRRPMLAGISAVSVVASAPLVVRLLSTGALAEVLSYGREAFTAVASGISFDSRIVVGVLVAAAVLLASILPLAGSARTERALVLLGPSIGVLASWVILRVVAEVIADGEFNYAGTKLLYGVVVMAAVTLLPTAAAGWTAGGVAPTLARLTLVAVALGVATTGPTVRTVEDWSGRLAPATPPHALAVVEAIERTTPELPVRCRPARGAAVTPTSRWAAYFCVRWVEDALNEDRQQAFRDAFLSAPDGTFDELVAQATAEGLYGFAYTMDLGPGWFGWDGRS